MWGMRQVLELWGQDQVPGPVQAECRLYQRSQRAVCAEVHGWVEHRNQLKRAWSLALAAFRPWGSRLSHRCEHLLALALGPVPKFRGLSVFQLLV